MQARALLPSEAETWRRLRLEALKLYPEAFLTTVAEAEALPVAKIEARLAAGNTLGVFDDEICLGCGTLIPNRYDLCRHRAEIGAFFVTPSAHGRGAGDALLLGLLQRARDLGCWQLELFVAEGNRHAQRMYARHGFQAFGRLPNSILTDACPIDDVFMVRTDQPMTLAP